MNKLIIFVLALIALFYNVEAAKHKAAKPKAAKKGVQKAKPAKPVVEDEDTHDDESVIQKIKNAAKNVVSTLGKGVPDAKEAVKSTVRSASKVAQAAVSKKATPKPIAKKAVSEKVTPAKKVAKKTVAHKCTKKIKHDDEL